MSSPATPQRSTTSYSGSYYGGYYSNGYHGSYYSGYHGSYSYGGWYSWFGFGWRWSWGGLYFGFGHRPWFGGWWGGPHIYFGTHSVAILGARAWYIQPYGAGWYGYCHGPRYYYYSHARRHHWFSYHGVYCRISRPYWYGYTRWWDWRPYSYGYTVLAYDSLYDDGYRDGYNRGYNRGYEDGAEEATGYGDDRRRDSIGGKRPQPEHDRARGDAGAEFRHEMSRGNEAFAQGDYAAAAKAFKEAAILNPESADARYALAMAALGNGKYAYSAFALRRGMALHADGSNIDVAKAFGGPVALKQHMEHMDRELAKAPQDPDLLLMRGFTALRSGDARTAAEMLDRALERAPDDKATHKLHEEALAALEG
ncbi:MAG: tetratricopeptide repeat protein [Planctomycetes bacterium]|nr:tetratricopeptide repeat protein [Planctomycetota bacterium]MCW8136454.1 tetratricopeptide repeat protein [Planctomycetota bacterium]